METIIDTTKKLFSNHKYSTATRNINNEKLDVKTQERLAFIYYREAQSLINEENRKRLILDLLDEALRLKPDLYGALEILGKINYEDALNSSNLDRRIKLLEKAKLQYDEAYKFLTGIEVFGKRRRQSLNRIIESLRLITSELNKYKIPEKEQKKEIKKSTIKDTIENAENCIIRSQFTAARRIINNIMDQDTVRNPDEDKNFNDLQLLLKYDLATNSFLNAEMDIENILGIKDIDIDTIVKLCKLCTRTKRFDVTYFILKHYCRLYPKDLKLLKELITFYIVTENYHHALYLLNKYLYDFGNNRDYIDFIKQTEFYLKSALGIKHDEPSTYYEQQISATFEERYTPAACKKHLENRVDFSIDRQDTLKPVYLFSKKQAPSQFEKLYNDVARKMINMIPDERGVLDIYTVKVIYTRKDRNGKEQIRYIAKNYGLETAVFKVETISNTKNIINIIPTGCECKESEKINVKKMS